MKTIAQLVNDLFRMRRRPDGQEYSCSDVSRALNGAIDPSYLSRMRKGKSENPTRQTLLLLCQFFEVEPNYFFPEIDVTGKKGNAFVFRSGGYGPEIDEKIADLLEAVQRKTRQESEE